MTTPAEVLSTEVSMSYSHLVSSLRQQEMEALFFLLLKTLCPNMTRDHMKEGQIASTRVYLLNGEDTENSRHL